MEPIYVKIMNKGPHPFPKYSTEHSAGMDLRAWIKNDDYRYDKEVILYPLERAMIHTGIYIALPEGYECQIRPRSGMALKRGLTVLNTPGTIDADYRGEICVIVVNLSNEVQKIEDGERICQMVVSKHETVSWIPSETLDETDRGEGGFGHTGNK